MTRRLTSDEREWLDYFRELGFDALYLSAPAAAPATEPSPAVDSGAGRPAATAEAATTLETLAAEAATCTKCKLSGGRQNVVFGSGHSAAELMFIGEGPGAQEDRQGLPFVGPSGELLTRILRAIDLDRDAVYIANIVKCRPPGNRDPEPDEVAACRGFLKQQIDLVRPRVIVVLGRVAAQTLLDTTTALGRLRGEWHSVYGVATRVTYHPAALLRNSGYRRPTWEDMQAVRDRLARERGEGE